MEARRLDAGLLRFLAGDSCVAYHPGTSGTYALEWLASSVSPPDILPPFFGLKVMQPVRDQPPR
jgi:hypothetical protein